MCSFRSQRYFLVMGRIRELGWNTVGDVALVVFVGGATWLAVFTSHNPVSSHIAGPRWLTIAFALVIALPLFWRRSRPLLACAVIAAGIVAQALASGNTPEGLQLIALWIVVPYSVAYYSDRPRALVGLVILLVAFAVYAAENTDITGGQAGNEWSGAFFLVLAIGSWLTGIVLRGRREAAALTARADALQQQAQLASAEERSRIARELHDIVAHNLSVVVVQAAGARAQAGQQSPSPSTLEKIERSGREALAEMRRLVGVLREDDAAGPELEPNPGVAQLPGLIDRVRAAGLHVELRSDGQLDNLPPAVDLSAYRIIQEALTNTLKHAGGQAHVWVRVSREPADLVIEIVDDGAGRSLDGPSSEGAGHGLVGMRERVALFGGQLHVGPRALSGFAVSARLPLGDPQP
jgi:signal transduction histidine kinase